MAHSNSQHDAPSNDPPTVVDRDVLGLSHQDDGVDSGTRTVLHRHGVSVVDDAAKPAGDLENDRTVITQRPPPMPVLPRSATPTELGSLLKGQQLGHFVLDEFVGGGGMGAVFRGTDLQLGRTVAVKVLSRDQGADPETLRRFKNEAQSAARLDHENIARVFFVGEHEGWNFIVFEYIEGVNVRDLIERGGPLSIEHAIEYTVQIAEALEHAADREVVHRDIKPSNILVTPDGRAKLVDMGLARLHHMEAGHSDLTASGVTLGTFDYISPEQASDPRRADVRSDMYSLGCTLYFMLLGRPPFPHGTVLQKLLAHSGEAPPDPVEQRAEIPPELSAIILRLLAKRPEQRYDEPRMLIGELLVLRDHLGLGEVHAATGFVRRSERLSWSDRLLTIGVPLALLILLVFGLDTYWSRSASNADQLPEFDVPAVEVSHRDASEEPIAPAESTTGPREVVPPVATPAGATTPTPSPVDTSATTDAVSPADAPPSTSTEPLVAEVNTDEPDVDVSVPGTSESEATESAPPVVDVTIRRIVIGSAAVLGDQGTNTRIFPTLSAALASEDFQAHIDHINVIEVRESRLVETTPLRIELPPTKHLTIRGVSTDAAPPEIQFTAEATIDFAGDRAMIDVVGGKLTLENLHLHMRVVGHWDRTRDVAMLRLPARLVDHVDLNSCVLTIENPAGEFTPSAAFIDVIADEDAQAKPVSLPIHLSDCILRGEATVVRMRRSTPVHFVWNNGLLVTSQRLLLAEGTTQDVDDATIRMSLLNVTAEVGEGLCLLRDIKTRPHQPSLELICNTSIISANGSTLVEHDGVGPYDDYLRSLFIRGDWNVYEDVGKFWAVSIENQAKPGLDWPGWDEKLEMGGSMPSSVEAIPWQRLRSDVQGVPIYLRGVEDYMLDPEATRSAAVQKKAGFRDDSLPIIGGNSLDDAPENETTDNRDAT